MSDVYFWLMMASWMSSGVLLVTAHTGPLLAPWIEQMARRAAERRAMTVRLGGVSTGSPMAVPASNVKGGE